MCIHALLSHEVLNPQEHRFCNVISGLRSALKLAWSWEHQEWQGCMVGTGVCCKPLSHLECRRGILVLVGDNFCPRVQAVGWGMGLQAQICYATAGNVQEIISERKKDTNTKERKTEGWMTESIKPSSYIQVIHPCAYRYTEIPHSQWFLYSRSLNTSGWRQFPISLPLSPSLAAQGHLEPFLCAAAFLTNADLQILSEAGEHKLHAVALCARGCLATHLGYFLAVQEQ